MKENFVMPTGPTQEGKESVDLAIERSQETLKSKIDNLLSTIAEQFDVLKEKIPGLKDIDKETFISAYKGMKDVAIGFNPFRSDTSPWYSILADFGLAGTVLGSVELYKDIFIRELTEQQKTQTPEMVVMLVLNIVLTVAAAKISPSMAPDRLI